MTVQDKFADSDDTVTIQVTAGVSTASQSITVRKSLDVLHIKTTDIIGT